MAEPNPSAKSKPTRAPYAPIVELTLLRLREFAREPGALFWVFGFPLVLAIGLGLAFRNQPPEPARVVVVQGADVAFTHAALTEPAGFLARWEAEDAALLLLRRGQVDLLIAVDAGRSLRFRYDDTRPEARLARFAAEDALERALGRRPASSIVAQKVQEPGTRYIDFLLPGLIGMNLLGSSLWGVGFTIVTQRKDKLLKRFAATPMRRSDFLLSLMASRMILITIEIVALLAIGEFAFGVHCHGSLAAAFAVSAVTGISSTGLGLCVAARTANTEVAGGLVNFVMMPMWLLSGSFFSATRFPDWLQPVVQALPLTAHNDALRAVMNEGATLASQAGELGILAVWGVVTFAAALSLFRWR